MTAGITTPQAEPAPTPERPAFVLSGPITEDTEIPPSLYGRFEAFAFLGKGGMGAVYKARDLRLGREVAVKLLFGADPERGGGLLREARSQARIAHENVCEVYEAGTADHVRYIVMQLIHGEPLDKAKASMSLEERVRVVRQVASALHEAHRLGLVHRDVKPSNIMVERGEDGAYRPYIMDFGLAREAGDSGATVTGAVMGTPAFMAPEQAEGKVRSLDRRTDVYSLGATLFDVIAGRPPFVAPHPWKLLMMVAHEDPPALGSVAKSVPPDLEAIVMKCLERPPSGRYESAKALGDDLQRFLDGDPVGARPRSFGYVLWTRARRHKGKVALGTMALIVGASFVGLWVRARRVASEQATLSRELGESVKEMEFFLRNAQGMPLHDLGRERDVVRGRLKEIEARMAAAGPIGVGPGHYALGEGHLALQEPEVAIGHLRQAEAAGYRSTGLDYAMGLVLGAIYKKELEATKRIEGEEKKKARIAAIEAETKAPALAHLRAALGGAIEAPAYVEGLIAFYEGRNEEALGKAREAFAKAPWLYEAKKLEGDVLFALGSQFGHDAAFDYSKMTKWFGEAGEAYRAAADLGRSDPAVHLATCELFTQQMSGAHAHGDSMRPSFEAAKAACERAILASPESGAGYIELAQAHAQFAWCVAAGNAADGTPEQAFAEAIPRAEEAVRRSTDDPMAHYVVGALWRSRALYAFDRGLEMSSAIGSAVKAYDEALRRDSVFLWALNELCSSLVIRAERDMMRGADPTRSLEEASTHCQRAVEIEPGFRYPRQNLIQAKELEARYRLSTGQSPEEPTKSAWAFYEELRRHDPKNNLLPWHGSILTLIDATYRLESGGDPSPMLERADEHARELERESPGSSMAFKSTGNAAALRARFLLEHGRDPSAALDRARAAFARLVAMKPWDVGFRVSCAQVEIMASRWALGDGKPPGAPLDAALAMLSPLLSAEHIDPALYEALGEIHELRAAYALAQREDPAAEMEHGLRAMDQALAQNPRMALALVGKSRIFRLRAQNAKDAGKKRDAEAQAAEAFSAAVRTNPWLTRLAPAP